MISPNTEPFTGGCAVLDAAKAKLMAASGCTGPQAENAIDLLGAASMSVAIFEAEPSITNAQEARTAVAAWDGPLSTRALQGVISKLSATARTQLLQAALTLYIAEHSTGEGSGV